MAPPVNEDLNMKKDFLLYITFHVAMTALVAGCGDQDPGGGMQSASMLSLVNGQLVSDSSATLVRTAGEIRHSVRTTATPGDAYTVWLCGFNRPEECSGAGNATPSCTFPELDTGVGDSFCQVSGGQVAGPDGSVFIEDVVSGDYQGEIILGAGVSNYLGAEIALILRSHGPALSDDPAALEAQLTTFNGGCPPNTCQDEQLAGYPGL